jgi:hypothetical protein
MRRLSFGPGRVLALSAAIATLSFSLPSHALESPATNFPIGVNTALSALYPPAGSTEIYNYNVFYTAGSYKADAGNPAPPSFKTNVFVEAFRINHTWFNITPDLTFGSGAAINLIHQTLSLPGVRANLGIGFANPALIPVNLDWHPTQSFWAAGILNILPNVGTYDKKKVLNGSVGYTSYVPELAVTYFPMPKLEVSLDARIDVNTKNHDTGYHSGNDFDLDYVVGYNPFPNLPHLQLAVNGYFFKQFSDDSLRSRINIIELGFV